MTFIHSLALYWYPPFVNKTTLLSPRNPGIMKETGKTTAAAAAAAAKLLQWCPTLCSPRDGSPQAPLSLGFSRQEYWRGLPFSSPMHACMLNHFSCVQLCATPWTAAHQAPLSTEFSRQEYWSGLPFPSPMHACVLNHFSRVWPCATLQTAAHQAPPSRGFSRQEYWIGLPFPSPLHILSVSNLFEIATY